MSHTASFGDRSGWSRPEDFTFSAGPWNLSTGADPFGPPIRPERDLLDKFRTYRELGFDYVQFHDDDAVPDDFIPAERERRAKEVARMLADHGLKAEFAAPRLWEDPRGADGPVTSNDPAARMWALERGKRTMDVAHHLGCDRVVWWPAREGTYIREAKDAVTCFGWMLEWVNALLDYAPGIKLLGEMKPNEPMDLMYLPTTGHWLALCYLTNDPSRMGALIETAHCILAGLDPSDEFAYALFHKKLWGVHLNDQNGLKFDQDKAFGSVNLRRAFNQADVLVRGGFGKQGEVVGLDVKAMRTQAPESAHLHLKHSRELFLQLVELCWQIDREEWQEHVRTRNYEALERFILRSLMGAGLK